MNEKHKEKKKNKRSIESAALKTAIPAGTPKANKNK